MSAQCCSGAGVLYSDAELASRGVRRVDLRSVLDSRRFAEVARVVSPLLAAQDDMGQPHSNDLLEEVDFPFESILACAHDTLKHYCDPSDLELYDAFSLHYDERQQNTTFNQHRDPSFVTINICLHADCEGSNVEFFGTPDASTNDRFAVEMRVGHALVHYGRHLHQTTPLLRGSRSQAVTYWTRKGIVADNDATYMAYVESDPEGAPR